MHVKYLALRPCRALRLLWILLATVGCVRDEEPSALERVRAQGLRAGFAIEPPYAFIDSASGEPTGEAPEILRRAADSIGITEVEWYPLPFHELITALVGGRIDVIASGMFVSPERSREVRFSVPTACVRPLLVSSRMEISRSGAGGATVAEPDGGSCDGCRVAVIQGSVELEALEQHGAARESVVVVPDLSTAVAAVQEGEADVVAISAPTARDLVRRDSTLKLDERGLPERVVEQAGGCPALGFRLADEDLALAFDSVLHEFVGSEEHVGLVAPFGFTEAELSCWAVEAVAGDAIAESCVAP